MFGAFREGRKRKGGRNSGWHRQLQTKWNKNPACHWCGQKTVIDGDRRSRKPDPLMATLDHVYSCYDIRRVLNGGQKTVVACLRCNNKRSAMETRSIYPNSYDKRNNKISIIELLKNNL